MAEARQVVEEMHEVKCVPRQLHHTYFVQALARAGNLQEAEEYLDHYQADDAALLAVLTACRDHADVKRAER